MKKKFSSSIFIHRRTTAALVTGSTALAFFPKKASALPDAFLYFPGPKEGAPIYISATVLLIAFITFIVLMARRVISTTTELNDITGELDATRQRQLETGKQLERTEETLVNTKNRYDGMLSDSEIGIFQMDLIGKCTFSSLTRSSTGGSSTPLLTVGPLVIRLDLAGLGSRRSSQPPILQAPSLL